MRKFGVRRRSQIAREVASTMRSRFSRDVRDGVPPPKKMLSTRFAVRTRLDLRDQRVGVLILQPNIRRNRKRTIRAVNAAKREVDVEAEGQLLCRFPDSSMVFDLVVLALQRAHRRQFDHQRSARCARDFTSALSRTQQRRGADCMSASGRFGNDSLIDALLADNKSRHRSAIVEQLPVVNFDDGSTSMKFFIPAHEAPRESLPAAHRGLPAERDAATRTIASSAVRSRKEDKLND